MASERKPVNRLGLLALIVLVVLIGVTGAWQVLETRRGIGQQAQAGNTALARAAASAIGTEIETQVDRTRFMLARPELHEIFLERDGERAQQAVDFIGVLYPDFVSAAMIDADGDVIAAWPARPEVIGGDASSEEGVRRAREVSAPVVTGPVVLRHGVQGIHITGGVRTFDGRRIGFLRLGFPVARFQALRADIGVPNEGSLFLLEAGGRSFGTPDEESTSVMLPVEAERAHGQSVARLPGLEGERIVGWARVPNFDWVVAVEQPLAAALRPATAVATRMGFIVLLVSMVAAIAAGFVARLLRKLTRERNRSTAILDSLADGAVTTDARGRIRTMNTTMEGYTGWTRAEAFGRPLSDVVTIADEEVQGDPLLLAIEDGRPVVSRGYTRSLVARDGRLTKIGVNAAPITDGDGRMIGGVALYRDVSFESELDQMKTGLVSTVSHELRTPLTMIQGFSELLLERDVDRKRAREAVQYINSSAQRLSRLIEDLLQVSHLDAGRVPVRLAPVDVAEAAEEALGPFLRRYTDRLFLTDLQGLPPIVGDRDMVTRILTNLVSNAVKYSPEGTRVEVRGRRDGDRVILEVVDRGIGMTSDEAARLFEKFFRSTHPDVQRVSGTGLGLYITRGLVQLQGGTIWASSQPGSGATFTVALPVAAADEAKERV